MPSERFSNETADHGLAEGLGIVFAAEDAGLPNPLAKWLARHPELASELANFLAGPDLFPKRISTPSPAGMLVGGLELREEIGRGGMGVVHRAFDPVLKRDVAVKLLRAGVELSSQELTRFRFEAEVVASFDHPNVVRVLSSGDSSGVPYLVMPLMNGGSLATRLKALGADRCLPAKQAAEIVRDIALGVHHAHERGLIHRDLKPGNILLDEKGRPHVADFGLARRVDVSASTVAGIAGTVAYMAPEQGRGEKQLTTAVDIHALGVILFELLTGGVPYGGTDIASMLRRLTDETEPVPLVSRFRSDVPADLEVICMRCLSRMPRDRYTSAQALADALDRFLNGELQIDAPRRGWASDFARVIVRRIDSPSVRSWPAFFWGLISLVSSHVAIQVVALTDGPVWVAYLGWGVYFGGWLVVIWLFGLSQSRELTRLERMATAQHVGMALAGIALLPVSFCAPDGYGLSLYPPLMVVVGLGTFIQGVYHWGRFYILGFGLLLLASIMPLLPMWCWPTFFVVLQIVFMVWAGFRMRALDREARTANLSE